MVGWKLNQLGFVNVSNILIDVFLTNILVVICVTIQCDWFEIYLPTKLVNLTNFLVVSTNMFLESIIGPTRPT